MITILEEWMVVDKWWKDQPIRTFYREVDWDGHLLTFKLSLPEMIWRIVKC